MLKGKTDCNSNRPKRTVDDPQQLATELADIVESIEQESYQPATRMTAVDLRDSLSDTPSRHFPAWLPVPRNMHQGNPSYYDETNRNTSLDSLAKFTKPNQAETLAKALTRSTRIRAQDSPDAGGPLAESIERAYRSMITELLSELTEAIRRADTPGMACALDETLAVAGIRIHFPYWRGPVDYPRIRESIRQVWDQEARETACQTGLPSRSDDGTWQVPLQAFRTRLTKGRGLQLTTQRMASAIAPLSMDETFEYAEVLTHTIKREHDDEIWLQPCWETRRQPTGSETARNQAIANHAIRTMATTWPMLVMEE